MLLLFPSWLSGQCMGYCSTKVQACTQVITNIESTKIHGYFLERNDKLQKVFWLANPLNSGVRKRHETIGPLYSCELIFTRTGGCGCIQWSL